MGDVTVTLALVSGTTAITTNDFVGQVFQRVPGTTAGAIAVSGTYTGSPPGVVQARVRKKQDNTVVIPYITLTSFTAAAGVWSGTIPNVPQGVATDGSGGAYQVDVKHAGLTAAGTTDCYVGINVAMYGQSNSHFMAVGPAASPEAAVAGTRWLHSGGTVNNPNNSANPADWSWMAVPAYGGARALLNRLCTLTGVPVGGFSVFQDATNAAFFTKENATHDLYDRLLGMAEYASGLEAVAIHQGESDTGVPPSTPVTKSSTYANYWRSVQANLCTDLGYANADDIHFALTSLATTCTAAAYVNDGFLTAQMHSDYNWMRIKTVHQFIDLLVPSIIYGGSNTLNTLSDGVHWNGDDASAPYAATGRRAAQALAKSMGAAASTAVFRIASGAIVDATHTDVNLTHGLGTDFTPTSGITGFEVSGNNGSSWVTPSAAVRQSASVIRLTHSDISAGGPRLLRYQWGNLPNANCGTTGAGLHASLGAGAVLDNGALTQPLEYTGRAIVVSDGKPSPLYIDGNHNPTFLSSATITRFANVDLGRPHANRLCVFVVNIDANTNADSLVVTPLTIVGVAQTPITATKVGQTNTASRPSVAIFQAALPDHWLASIDVTYAASLFNTPDLVVYQIDSSLLNSTTGTFAGTTQASGTSLATTISTTAGGLMIAGVSFQAGTNLNVEAVGGTEAWRPDWHIGMMANLGHTASAAPISTNASNNVAFTISGTGTQALGVVTYR